MPTILIIEDEEDLRMMLTALLGHAGYRVLVAAGGEQGIRLARAHRPDLVVTDVRMPGVNGHDALATLRATPGLEALPVIIMTAHADLPDMRRGMTLGADDYVAKPFENAELLRIVARHLERAQLRRREAGQELSQWRHHLGALLPQHVVAPLHDIIGCASVLALDAAAMPAAEVREFALTIDEAATRLHRQVENLLLFTQLEAGAVEPGRGGGLVAVDELVRQRCELVAARHQRSTTLQLELAPVQATVDREQLGKAVAELIDNACRHTPASSPVIVRVQRQAEGFVVQIIDRGPGVPTAVLQTLAPTPTAGRTTAAAGVGLGLYLSHRLTHLLGGTWRLEPAPGGGTRATLTFPALRGSPAGAAAPAKAD